MKTRKAFSLNLAIFLCLSSPLAAAPTSADPLVADAAMRGELETVVSLVNQNVDVNVSQGDGMTALHWAAQHGDLAMVDVLLAAGANPEAGTRIGRYTPLHLASRGGHGAAVRVLLEGGADPRATNTSGTTSLHFAGQTGSVDAVKALLDHGADVNARESSAGQTPLIFASAFNRVEAMEVLIEYDAGLDITTKVVDVSQVTRVNRQAQRRRTEVLQEFRDEAPPEEQETWSPTPSQVQAAIRAALEVQESESSESPEEVGEEAKGGMTALHHAARQGHERAALALIDAGADIDRVSADGSSPLQMATMNGHFDLAMLLVEHSADPNIATQAGATPLFAAINVQWAPFVSYPQPRAQDQQEATLLDLMQALLEAGADPNLRTNRDLWYVRYNVCCSQSVDGATPFWRATYALDVEAMRLLVQHGADWSIPTRAGRMRFGNEYAFLQGLDDPSGLPPVPEGGPGQFPIHAASGIGYGVTSEANSHRHVPEGWLASVKYLVEELGVDVNQRDFEGFNAVHHAAARGDIELIRFLVEHGADVTAVSRRGHTTADMANSPPHLNQSPILPFPEVIEWLESLGSENNHNCSACL